jgi:hypothetical protein
MTTCHVRLDRPKVAEEDVDLTDDQADGLACIRCGQVDGPMVPVGTVERPPAVLDRLGVSRESVTCQVVAHVECRPPPAT